MDNNYLDLAVNKNEFAYTLPVAGYAYIYDSPSRKDGHMRLPSCVQAVQRER